MDVTGITVGNEYVFKVPNDERVLQRACLTGLIGKTKYDGLVVEISTVSTTSGSPRIWLKHNDVVKNHSTLRSCWFPPEFFSPADFELVVGGLYVCDKKPTDISFWGWAGPMTKNIGKPMTCMKIIEAKNGRPEALQITFQPGGAYIYGKNWVRPYRDTSTNTVTKKKRNLFNFWPTKGKE